jgi:hypothetical protein
MVSEKENHIYKHFMVDAKQTMIVYKKRFFTCIHQRILSAYFSSSRLSNNYIENIFTVQNIVRLGKITKLTNINKEHLEKM